MSAPDASPKRSVFLVDDHPLALEWLSSLISRQPDLEICGATADRAEALQLIASKKPQIVLVDISLEGPSGVALIRDIRTMATEAAAVVLSVHDEAFYAERALRAGARAYVVRQEIVKQVLHAIRSVLDGKFYVSEGVALTMAEKLIAGNGPVSSVEKLSNRELEVFQLLGRGYRTRQIAENLNVNIKTVQAFYARMKEKLQVNNATELLREALRWTDHRD
jgi:DNA-binding NarL/FixJ family response regulator